MTTRLRHRRPASALQLAARVSSAGVLRARAEAWRPWRTYAALHLWLHDGAHLGSTS